MSTSTMSMSTMSMSTMSMSGSHTDLHLKTSFFRHRPRPVQHSDNHWFLGSVVNRNVVPPLRSTSQNEDHMDCAPVSYSRSLQCIIIHKLLAGIDYIHVFGRQSIQHILQLNFQIANSPI